MMCRWKELMAVLPPTIRRDVDTLGQESAREIRLRVGYTAQLNLGQKQIKLIHRVTGEDLQYVITAASRYSPWCSASVAMGYLTAEGGHRIGVCGEFTAGEDRGTVKKPTSLCIRVARDVRGIAPEIPGSVLILGPPGWGKTTLLRDLARSRSKRESITVIDDRGELFPEGMDRGPGLDVMQFCPKSRGISMALRTMGPETIAVDEITEGEDCRSLIAAANCGVKLLATVHAESLEDLRRREIYRELLHRHIFDTVLRLNRDQTWSRERMGA